MGFEPVREDRVGPVQALARLSNNFLVGDFEILI